MRETLGEKLDQMDKDKEYITKYKERYVKIKALKKDQEESMNQIGMTKMYLKWYKQDEAEQDKDKVNYSQTLLNTLKHIAIYQTYLNYNFW